MFWSAVRQNNRDTELQLSAFFSLEDGTMSTWPIFMHLTKNA